VYAFDASTGRTLSTNAGPEQWPPYFDGLASVALAMSSGPSSITHQAPLPTPVPNPSTFVPAPVELLHTGGPYIGEAAALARAATFTLGNVMRQEVHMLNYSVVSQYLGSDDSRVAQDREMYFVITSAPYVTRGSPETSPVTCQSFIAVFDATTGDPFVAGCEGAASWPARVPPGFATK
jgi:hypothetical protein